MAKNRGMLDTVPEMWAAHWEFGYALAKGTIVVAKTATSVVEDAEVELQICAAHIRNAVDDQLVDLGTSRTAVNDADNPIDHLAQALRKKNEQEDEEVEIDGVKKTRKEWKEILNK